MFFVLIIARHRVGDIEACDWLDRLPVTVELAARGAHRSTHLDARECA